MSCIRSIQAQLRQFYVLERGSDELKIHTKLDWHHRRTLLKVLFPTNILSRYAKYDIDGGYIEPTHNNTVLSKHVLKCLHMNWVDLSQYDYGVCIINDGKHGRKIEWFNDGDDTIKNWNLSGFLC